MLFLLVIIIAVGIGAVVGKLMDKNGKSVKIGPAQTVIVFLLVFFMGMKIGSDESILDSVRSIGISATIVTVAVLVGSVLAVYLWRKLLKFNKEGTRKSD